jgi:hypothetical protein
MRTSVRRCEQDAYTGALMHDAPLVCDYELGFCLFDFCLLHLLPLASGKMISLLPPNSTNRVLFVIWIYSDNLYS